MQISTPTLVNIYEIKDPRGVSFESISHNLSKLNSELEAIQSILDKTFDALLSQKHGDALSSIPKTQMKFLSIEYLKDNQPYNRLISLIQKSKTNKESILNRIVKLKESLEWSGRRKSKYRMYSPNTKRQVLETIASGLSIKEASDLFSVPIKSAKRWLEIGPDRKKGCGRKIHDPELESNIINWYNEYKSQMKITSSTFRRMALMLSKDKKFKASKGWLEKLKRKYSIRLDRER